MPTTAKKKPAARTPALPPVVTFPARIADRLSDLEARADAEETLVRTAFLKHNGDITDLRAAVTKLLDTQTEHERLVAELREIAGLR